MIIKVSKKAIIYLVIAAATENYDNSENDDPGAVIVKEMAKAVVVHSIFLRSMFAIFTAHLYSMIGRYFLTQGDNRGYNCCSPIDGVGDKKGALGFAESA